MKYRASYPIKIWIISAVVGSMLLYWGSYIFAFDVISHGGTVSDRLFMWMTITAFSLIASVPAMLLFWLAVHQLTRTKLKLETIKVWLGFIGVMLAYISLIALVGFDTLLKGGVHCYTLPLVLGAYYFKLSKRVE